MKTALIATNAASMVRLFNENNIQLLADAGYEIHIACNFEKNNTFPQDEVNKCKAEWESRGFILHQYSTSRNPLSFDNIKAYFALKKLFKAQKFDLIHCHAPISSVICRLAAKKYRSKGTRVMYTAHGFHFFKGAPILNWLIYYPIEWICAFFTDELITINTEDYSFAKKHMHAKQIEYIPGVGVDLEKYRHLDSDRMKKRKELGIPEDYIAVLSVGELNDNKNHATVLRAVAKLNRPDIIYVICGEGPKKAELLQLAEELGVKDRLLLLGYRSDIAEINNCCDIFAFPSKREGLPMSLMESIATGLPSVVSAIRGNVDLIKDGVNGFLCDRLDVDAFAEKIQVLVENPDLRIGMGKNSADLLEKFSLDSVCQKMSYIYFGESAAERVAPLSTPSV